MKQCLALLLLLLMGITHFSGIASTRELCIEQAPDGEESTKENKEGKKESKECTVALPKANSFGSSENSPFKAHESLILPAPVIDKQTPPPNSAG